jgi:protein-S-isoprenylcysteine O-methyltransferase Ste14
MTLSPRAEDLLGKLLLLVAFGMALFSQVGALRALVLATERPDTWALKLSSQLLSLLFVGMIIALTIRRLPARTSASGWEPRAAAIGGTFLLIVLMWLPMGAASAPVLVTANVLMLVGTLGSLWCLHFLGRSFAVMASARELVTGGPYQLVRHPLYVAEAITVLGVVMAHWSLAAVLVGAAQFALQFRRMQHEERILREAFPEYDAYAQRVPMIWPSLGAAAAQPR